MAVPPSSFDHASIKRTVGLVEKLGIDLARQTPSAPSPLQTIAVWRQRLPPVGSFARTRDPGRRSFRDAAVWRLRLPGRLDPRASTTANFPGSFSSSPIAKQPLNNS